ncbi:FAD binding domain-containing protein [Microbaculum marinisediminis]|uniref:FAD binding domain-containing protein n=1 Tax=Microbaculum marinisediminis TaxID=2931392 RepID=A0AAW5R5W1_9HYPH|nr:FAD binding domain-containing protein [Microbaculum sp. A6E488]MCT8973910.1 FAD binding domain-containing protein [Microbaculum sp. A6E488]
MLTCDQYHMPATLHEALALWRAAPEGSRLVAGATDILPWAREGRGGNVHLPAMIDLSRVADLSGYSVADGRVRLGANVAYQQFLTDETLRRHLPCMPYCAIWFADDQIREQATLAGNIVNASPAADGTPPVLALNGEIEMAGLDGDAVVRRSLPVDDFLQGPGKTALQPGEIVTAVTCDSLQGYGGSFQKVGQRRSLVISSVCAVACVKTDPGGTVFEDVRLALGGIGPVPVRLGDVEAILNGKPISQDIIAEASAIPPSRVASRTRQDYRRAVVRGFVEAAIEEALADAGAPLQAAREREKSHV